MIVDFNAYVGSWWPAREQADGRPGQVRKRLESAGIEGAFVALMEGPWYRDEQAGNERLAELVAEHRDFFVPLACLDPTAAYCTEDLDRCAGELGMAGVRIYPAYHHYRLDDARVAALARELARRRLPLFVTILIEEGRFEHAAVTQGPGAGMAELAALVTAAAETTFVVSMELPQPAARLLSGRDLCRGRVFFDVSRADKPTLGLEDLIDKAGPGQLLLGTNTPFFYPEGAVMNLAYRDVADQAVGDILARNYQASPVLRDAVGRREGAVQRGPSRPAAPDPIGQLDVRLGDLKGRIIDMHAHPVADEAMMLGMVEQAKRAGIARLILHDAGLQGSTLHGVPRDPTGEQIQQFNAAAARWRDRLDGFAEMYAYVNPRHGRQALRDAEQWVRQHGAVGLKMLWCRQSDGGLGGTFDVVAKAAELGVPVLFHTFFRKGGNDEGEISPLEIAEMARAHPAAKIILAHCGGDWIRTARTVRELPNVHADTSGCTWRAGFTEYVVRTMGAERVLYGADMPARAFGAQIAKVLAPDLTHAQRRLIFYGNAERLFGL